MSQFELGAEPNFDHFGAGLAGTVSAVIGRRRSASIFRISGCLRLAAQRRSEQPLQVIDAAGAQAAQQRKSRPRARWGLRTITRSILVISVGFSLGSSAFLLWQNGRARPAAFSRSSGGKNSSRKASKQYSSGVSLATSASAAACSFSSGRAGNTRERGTLQVVGPPLSIANPPVRRSGTNPRHKPKLA